MKFLFLCFFLVSSHLLANITVIEYLSAQRESYRDHGAVLEELASLYLNCTLNTTSIKNVKYFDNNYNLRGELDILLVVEDKIIAVVEVKNWIRIESALQKAHKQLNRFKDHLIKENISTFVPSLSQEFDNPEYITVSYEGTDVHGFDYAVPISYEKIKEYFKKLTYIQQQEIPEQDYCYLISEF